MKPFKVILYMQNLDIFLYSLLFMMIRLDKEGNTQLQYSVMIDVISVMWSDSATVIKIL